MLATGETEPHTAVTLFTVYGTGAVYRWEFVVDATSYTTNGYDGDGVLVRRYARPSADL